MTSPQQEDRLERKPHPPAATQIPREELTLEEFDILWLIRLKMLDSLSLGKSS